LSWPPPPADGQSASPTGPASQSRAIVPRFDPCYTCTVAYEIRLSEDARRHLRRFSRRETRTILDRIQEALRNEPRTETRNLKRLRPNPLSKYELKIGDFRAFFEVLDESREVLVLAIGRKEGNRLWIGGREVNL